MKSIEVLTIDTDVVVTDVVVTLVGAFLDLIRIHQYSDIWIAFDIGKNLRFYSINATVKEPKSRVLPVFHALTGFDITSAIIGKGKKLAWQVWQVYEDITDIHSTDISPF